MFRVPVKKGEHSMLHNLPSLSWVFAVVVLPAAVLMSPPDAYAGASDPGRSRHMKTGHSKVNGVVTQRKSGLYTVKTMTGTNYTLADSVAVGYAFSDTEADPDATDRRGAPAVSVCGSTDAERSVTARGPCHWATPGGHADVSHGYNGSVTYATDQSASSRSSDLSLSAAPVWTFARPNHV